MRLLFSILIALFCLSADAATTVLTNTGTTLVAGSVTNSVRRGLVLDLDFDVIQWTGSAATNLDKSGLGINGGLVSATLTNSGVPGARGQAMQFPLSNDRVECGSPATLDNMTNGLTISMWVRSQTFSGTAYLFAKGAAAGRKQLLLSNGYPLRSTFLVDCNTTDYSELINQLIPTNQWVHLAVTWSGGVTSNSCLWYVNGMLCRSTSATDGVGGIVDDAANNLTLGGYNGEGAWPGTLDQYKVFTNVLTQSEIVALYEEGKFLIPQPLLTNGTWVATNFINLDGLASGAVMSIQTLSNITSGFAAANMGPWQFNAADTETNRWTVVPIGTLTLPNPISVNGTTYSTQTNALAFNCAVGVGSGWNCTMPKMSNVTMVTHFRSSRYYTGNTVPHDILNVGATANDSVAQIREDYVYKISSHTVSNNVSLDGGRAIFRDGFWYRVVHCWDGEHGLAHTWFFTTDDWPVPTERGTPVYYGISSLPSGTNATFWGIIDTTHGAAGPGTNYWTGTAIIPGLASQLGFQMRTNYFTGGLAP